jgi:hypothetical protein
MIQTFQAFILPPSSGSVKCCYLTTLLHGVTTQKNFDLNLHRRESLNFAYVTFTLGYSTLFYYSIFLFPLFYNKAKTLCMWRIPALNHGLDAMLSCSFSSSSLSSGQNVNLISQRLNIKCKFLLELSKTGRYQRR